MEARAAARDLSGAFRLMRSGEGWVPPVLTCSALHGTGIDEVWKQVLAHRASMGDEGLARKRAEQQVEFTWSLVRDVFDQRLRASSGVAAIRDSVRDRLLAGDLTAPAAADELVAAYDADQD
jgi:LAO/AO transport system kinase